MTRAVQFTCVIWGKIRGVPNSRERHYKLSVFNAGGGPAEAHKAAGHLHHSEQNASLEGVLYEKEGRLGHCCGTLLALAASCRLNLLTETGEELLIRTLG